MALTDQLEAQGNWLFKYRGILPLIIFLIGLFLFLRNEASPEKSFFEKRSLGIYYETTCLLISFLGFFIRVYTVGYTPANTSGRNTERQVADVLNTKGVYSIVRNPLYLGNFFMWMGIAMLTGDFWFTIAFTLFYFLYYERIIFTEENYLKSKFGQQYTDWTHKTPVIVPNFSSFLRPMNDFSWRKVLRQEKNGFAALFLIFCFFDIAGELVKKQQHYNEILLISGSIAVLTYLILKFLKYNTNLLHDKQAIEIIS